MNSFTLTLLGLFLQGGQAAPPQEVKIGTREGHELVGITPWAEFRIDTSLGPIDLKLAQLRSVYFSNEGKVTAEHKDGSSFSGAVAVDSVSLTSRLGELVVPRASLREVEVIQAVKRRPKQTPSLTPVISATVSMNDGNRVMGSIVPDRLKIQCSLGALTAPLLDVETVMFDGKGGASVVLVDGSRIVGKLQEEEYKVTSSLREFTLRPETIKSIQIAVTWVQPVTVTPKPSSGGEPSPVVPAPGGPAPAATTATSPWSHTLGLTGAITRLLLSPDGSTAYALDASASKLLVLDGSRLTLKKEYPLEGGERTFVLSGDGAILVALGKQRVTLLSASDGKMMKSFAVEADLTDGHLLDGNTLLANTNSGGIVAISIPKTAILQTFRGSSPGPLRMHPDGRRLYTGNGHLKLPPKGRGIEDISDRSFLVNSSGYTGVPFEISPDGRVAVFGHGPILRLGKSEGADMLPLASVERHQAAGFHAASKRLLIFTDQSFVKEYDSTSFELIRSQSLGVAALLVAVVPQDGSLLVYGVEPGKGGRSVPTKQGQHLLGGDLYRFEPLK